MTQTDDAIVASDVIVGVTTDADAWLLDATAVETDKLGLVAN